MMEYEKWFDRTLLLTGNDKYEKISRAHILVAGLGGVGGVAAELLVRAGIGEITIVDHDRVSASNINRQVIALHSSIGKQKAELWRDRLLDINPDLKVHLSTLYLKDEASPALLSCNYDYVIDAIDTLSPKVFFIYAAIQQKHRIISSLGSASKFDPEQVKVCDISESYNCNLAYYVRKRLHKLEIFSGVDVVFSPEMAAADSMIKIEGEQNKKTTRGTISYMPWIFGAHAAAWVIRKLMDDEK